jgi:glutathione S-transferase
MVSRRNALGADLHLTEPAAWAAATGEGAYRLSPRDRTLADVGFVHCAYRDQVLDVAERFYPDAGELTLLVIDLERLGSPVRAENLEGGEELFPHIYGPLELGAVTEGLSIRRGGDGRFQLPPEV